MKVFDDLKTHGVDGILIAVTDRLTGMAEALAVVYPATALQTGIVQYFDSQLANDGAFGTNPAIDGNFHA